MYTGLSTRDAELKHEGTRISHVVFERSYLNYTNIKTVSSKTSTTVLLNSREIVTLKFNEPAIVSVLFWILENGTSSKSAFCESALGPQAKIVRTRTRHSIFTNFDGGGEGTINRAACAGFTSYAFSEPQDFSTLHFSYGFGFKKKNKKQHAPKQIRDGFDALSDVWWRVVVEVVLHSWNTNTLVAKRIFRQPRWRAAGGEGVVEQWTEQPTWVLLRRIRVNT